MFANGNRKRKSSDARDESTHEYGPRCPHRLRLTANDNDRDGLQASCLEASPPSLPSAAPDTRRSARETTRFRSDEDQTINSSRSRNENKKEFTFFSFPGELRNMIYNYSLHYPDSRRLYATYYRRPSISKNSPEWEPRLHAPTILLLNKRITKECLPILKSTKLVIDRLPPPRACDVHRGPLVYVAGYYRHSYFMHLSEFISPRTLQNIPQIDINVGLCEGPLGSGWAWKRVVDELLEILTQRNACVKLRLILRLCNTDDYPNVWHSDRDYHLRMIKKIDKFSNVNPNVFAQREVKLEVWRIEGRKATYVDEKSYPRPLMIIEDGSSKVLCSDETLVEERPIPAPRMYPDREMFPGSILEFVRPAPPPFYGLDDST